MENAGPGWGGETARAAGRGIMKERRRAPPLTPDQVIARLRTGLAISGEVPVSRLAKAATGLNEFLDLFGLESSMWADNGRFSLQIFETE